CRRRRPAVWRSRRLAGGAGVRGREDAYLDAGGASVGRELHHVSGLAAAVDGDRDLAGAHAVGIVDADAERALAPPHARAKTVPAPGQAGRADEDAVHEPQPQDVLDRQPPGPAGRARLPAPAAAAGVRRAAGDVAGHRIGFDPVALRFGPRACVGDRTEPVEHALGHVAVAEHGEGDARPGGGVGVLAAVLADAGRIGLDVAGVARRG